MRAPKVNSLSQAQISAALSPAFAADADPQVMSAACRICAAYVGSGLNQDLSTLSRVLRLLSSLLDVCSGTVSSNHGLLVSDCHSKLIRSDYTRSRCFKDCVCACWFDVAAFYLVGLGGDAYR